MDAKSFFDSLKIIVLNNLSKIPNARSIEGLRDLCNNVEDNAQKLCVQLTYKFAYKIFKSIPNKNFFDFIRDNNGYIYSIKVADDILERQKLLIAITNLQTKQDIVKLYVSLNTTGKYNNICIIIPQKLIKNETYIQEFYKCILETSYNWFKEQVLLFINNNSICVANKLYTYMRSIVSQHTLLANFWFAIVGKGCGFRLLDYELTLNAFELIDKNIYGSGSYTNKLLTELISTKLPTDKMLMQIAIENEATLVGELSKAAYTNEGSIYSATLYALYGGESFVIVPLHIDEFSILALFPVDLKYELESILQENIVLIRQLIQEELSSLIKAYDLFIEYPNDDLSMNDISLCVKKILKFLNEARENISPFAGIDILNIFKGHYDYDQNIFENALKILEQNQYVVKNNLNNYTITEAGLTCLRNGDQTNMNNSDNKGNMEFKFYGGDFRGSAIGSSFQGNMDINTSGPDLQYITSLFSQIVECAYKEQDVKQQMILEQVKELQTELAKTQPKKDVVYKILDWMSKTASIAGLALKLKEVILPFLI